MSLRILSLTFITLAGSSSGRLRVGVTTLLLAGLTGDRERSARDARCGHDGVKGNRRSHIYHWPGCPNYNDIAEHDRVEFANSIEAEKAGYRAAYNCP